MFEQVEYTRQIYWSPLGGLPPLLTGTTYVWLALAMACLLYGIWRHYRLWRLGQKEVFVNSPVKRISFFLKYVLGQYKILKARRMRGIRPLSYYAAIMHGLIFYGFLGLVFGTTIVALKHYHIVDVYHGWFYLFVTVVCELSGLALMVGLAMGIFRRSQKKYEFKHGWDYSVLYGFLFLLTVQGYFLEGFRLAYQDPPVYDLWWSFVGAGFSLFYPTNLSTQTAETLYSSIWYFHMVTTMAFIAAVPYTRAFHIVTASLNLLTQRLEPSVLLARMNLDNAEADHFGPKTIREFTWKDLLSFDSCTECRKCTDICPANAAEKSLDPRLVILKLRDSLLAERQIGKGESPALYETGVINHDEIWACTNCGACVEVCPVGIDQPRAIMQLRRYQTLSLGEVPPTAAKAIENIKQQDNPWGISKDDRSKWAEGLDVPVITDESPEVEWLYWVGCAGAYDANNQKVTKSVVHILKTAGVSFAVMGNRERCSGEPVKRLGDEYSFAEIARSNVENLDKLKFKKVVTHCPHCFNTLKNDYPVYGGKYEVYHHTQLLTALHKAGKLTMPNTRSGDVTFHDPCFLGRHNHEYQAPRELLNAIEGLQLKEMEYHSSNSHCCGMGGGNMWYESKGGHSVVKDRLAQVAQTQAKTLVTGCSFCLINFKGAFKDFEPTKDLQVMDIAEVVSEAMHTQ